ncbi:MAG: hypothetical protein ACTSQY_03470 [Candidatus Odinarchaeia archaeon]
MSRDERIKEKVSKDSKRTFFEKVIQYIPLYHGYKEKENRREADKILREYIFSDFKKIINKLRDIRDVFIEKEMEDVYIDLDKTIDLYEMMAQKIKYADYGYAGFFDKIKINEAELDRMYEFDASILEDIKTIDEVVRELQGEVDNEQFTNISKHVKRIGNVIEQLEDKFTKREEYMHKFTD